MVSRREFLGALSVPAASLAIGGSFALRPLGTAEAGDIPHDLPNRQGRGEDFWFECARAFTVDRSLVNLNNGGVSPSPQFVQAAMKRHLDFSNAAPPYTMWRVLEPQREAVRERFARRFGCDTEEIAFTRNASEGLQICQLGFDLRRGDEVLTTNQDYPRMLTTFKQRERREGIVLKQFSIPIPAEDDDHIVALFEQHITPKTKLILMCHVINITGQLLPVRKVVAMARAKGIPVIVDGAHALAHFDFRLSDLDCDYYATSLHKWLFAPHGTGSLYVRRDKIADLWPLMAASEEQEDDIRKFEEIGTHPAANTLAISEALTFHQGIGGERKEAGRGFLRHRHGANRRCRFKRTKRLALEGAPDSHDGHKPRRIPGRSHITERLHHAARTGPLLRCDGARRSPRTTDSIKGLSTSTVGADRAERPRVRRVPWSSEAPPCLPRKTVYAPSA